MTWTTRVRLAWLAIRLFVGVVGRGTQKGTLLVWARRVNALHRWRARRRYHALGPDEQMVVWAHAIKSSPELRALWRDALNVKGREEVSAPGVRKQPALWTPGGRR